MYRVNVEGTVLALDGAGLIELLVSIRTEWDGIITRCKGGYVVDSLGKSSVMVNVTPIPANVLACAA